MAKNLVIFIGKRGTRKTSDCIHKHRLYRKVGVLCHDAWTQKQWENAGIAELSFLTLNDLDSFITSNPEARLVLDLNSPTKDERVWLEKQLDSQTPFPLPTTLIVHYASQIPLALR